MYSAKQIYFEIEPVGDNSLAAVDLWVQRFRSVAEAAGWTSEVVKSNTIYTTEAEEEAFPPPLHILDVNYMVLETGNPMSPILVIGDPLGSYVPTPTPTTVIETGSRAIPALHAGVVQAILLMHPTWTAVPISTSQTMFLTENESNATRPVPDPALFLHTNAINGAISEGGRLFRSVPSTRTFVKQIGAAFVPILYGEDNYIEMYAGVHTRQLGQSLNFDFSRSFSNVTDAAGNVIPYPPVTPVPLRASTGPVFEVSGAQKVVGFINPHFLVCHRSNLVNQFLLAGGLKLMDIRTSLAQDPFVTKAIVGVGSTPGLGGGNGVSFSTAPYAQGTAFLQRNDISRICTDHLEEASSGFHVPLFAQAFEGAIAVWEGDTGEVYDPWAGFDADPLGDHLGAGSIHSPYFAQMWDVMLYSSRRVSAPQYPWDTKLWKVYSDSPALPYTSAFRYTDTMIV